MSWEVGGSDLRSLAKMYELWASARGDGGAALSPADHDARAYRVTGTRAAKIWVGQEDIVVKDILGERSSFTGNLATALGHTNEPMAAWWVCRLADIDVATVRLQATTVSEELIDDATGYCWASVSPDALCTTRDGLEICLEFKNTSKKDEWGYGGEGFAGVAKRYQGQVLWQRRLLGVDEVWVVMSHATEMRIYRVPPHPVREEQLIDKCREVWGQNIREEVIKNAKR